jgi:hypothetical protein
MSDKNLEQPVNKFCAKIHKSDSETLTLLRLAYVYYVMTKPSVLKGIMVNMLWRYQVLERHTQFKKRWEDVLTIQDHACMSSITLITRG